MLDTLPRVVVMVCAAGICSDAYAHFLNLSKGAFCAMRDVIVVGTFIPAQEVARRMTAGGCFVTGQTLFVDGGKSLGGLGI